MDCSQMWAHLQQCEETRRQQFRFRKDPASYLAALEAQLLTIPLRGQKIGPTQP